MQRLLCDDFVEFVCVCVCVCLRLLLAYFLNRVFQFSDRHTLDVDTDQLYRGIVCCGVCVCVGMNVCGTMCVCMWHDIVIQFTLYSLDPLERFGGLMFSCKSN